MLLKKNRHNHQHRKQSINNACSITHVVPLKFSLSCICPVGLSDKRNAMKSSATAAMISLETHPNHHSHLPLPFGRRHRSGLDRGESSAITSGSLAARFLRLNLPSADSLYVMGSPCGSLTRSYICCCMPIFVSPPPCGIGLDGGQDAMTHRRRGFVRPVVPHSPVIFSAVPTSET